jgi:DNA invertase Pin-like site-specific DNA recombinase
MTHLVTVIEELRGRQVGFRALGDGAIAPTTASGECIFHIFAALAQCERRWFQERPRAGFAAARAWGRKGERQPRRAAEPRVRMADAMSADQQLSAADICQTLRLSQAPVYRYVALGRRGAENLGETQGRRERWELSSS